MFRYQYDAIVGHEGTVVVSKGIRCTNAVQVNAIRCTHAVQVNAIRCTHAVQVGPRCLELMMFSLLA